MSADKPKPTHTHVWTHENQEPFHPGHHHGFNERVLKSTERIIDLDGVTPATVWWPKTFINCAEPGGADFFDLLPDDAEAHALRILAAVAEVRAHVAFAEGLKGVGSTDTPRGQR